MVIMRTENSLVVVAVDASLPSDRIRFQIESWLSCAHYMGSGHTRPVRVMLLFTHADKIDEDKMRELRSAYAGATDFFRYLTSGDAGREMQSIASAV
jgi:hypothetical protein